MGTIYVGGTGGASPNGGGLTLNGAQSLLTGTGAFVFAGTTSSTNANNALVINGTIGAGFTVDGQHGSISEPSAGAILVNNGTIDANVPDGRQRRYLGTVRRQQRVGNEQRRNYGHEWRHHHGRQQRHTLHQQRVAPCVGAG